MSLLEEVLVHLHDVAIGYDVPLIEDINIEVIAGDVIAVLGPSGIGKTTLLRTIAGLVRPLEGDVELAVPSRGGLGYIPQRLGLIGNLTVRDNVEMGTRVGLSRWHLPFIPVPAKQRRVATAKTVAQRPKLVLADEFLGELDDDNVEIVMKTVRQAIEAQNSAMIMVEHHEELAKQVANRIWRIKDGRLIEELIR